MTEENPETTRLRRAARIAAPVAAVALYAGCVGGLLLVLRGATDAAAGDGFGRSILLWAIYLLPALVAPAVGALFAALLYGERGRHAAYWPNLGLIAAFTAIAMIWLLIAGGTWNVILAIVQLAGGVLAWILLRGAARGGAKRRG
ncbi:MAG: hypothetical protein KIT16_05100 [Rhodospirillaceae bacterium]|nr:hypothetical protein [Rhodospirillaceae bacterium]